jgi:hypothetical protein
MNVLLSNFHGYPVHIIPHKESLDMLEVAHRYLKSSGHINPGDPNTEEAHKSRENTLDYFYPHSYSIHPEYTAEIKPNGMHITSGPSKNVQDDHHTEGTHPIFHKLIRDHMLSISPLLTHRDSMHQHFIHLHRILENGYYVRNTPHEPSKVIRAHTPIHEQRTILSLYKNYLLHPDTDKDALNFNIRSNPHNIPWKLMNNQQYDISPHPTLMEAMSDEGVRKDMHALLDHVELKGGVHTLVAKALRTHMIHSINAHPFEIKDLVKSIAKNPFRYMNQSKRGTDDYAPDVKPTYLSTFGVYRHPSDPLHEPVSDTNINYLNRHVRTLVDRVRYYPNENMNRMSLDELVDHAVTVHDMADNNLVFGSHEDDGIDEYKSPRGVENLPHVVTHELLDAKKRAIRAIGQKLDKTYERTMSRTKEQEMGQRIEGLMNSHRIAKRI